MKIGPTRWSRGGLVRFARYSATDELAIQIINPQDGQPELTATVNVTSYGAPPPGRYGVWLKGWEENEGVPEALVAAGVVRLTGRTFQTGFVEAQHAELTEAAIAELGGAAEPR